MHSLEQHAQSLEASRTVKGFYYRAYKITREQILSRQASKENLASALGISSRHLHRQLSRENINYRALHEQVMLTLTIEYLSTSNRTIENIAMALGYTESHSFAGSRNRPGKRPVVIGTSRCRVNPDAPGKVGDESQSENAGRAGCWCE